MISLYSGEQMVNGISTGGGSGEYTPSGAGSQASAVFGPLAMPIGGQGAAAVPAMIPVSGTRVVLPAEVKPQGLATLPLTSNLLGSSAQSPTGNVADALAPAPLSQGLPSSANIPISPAAVIPPAPLQQAPAANPSLPPAVQVVSAVPNPSAVIPPPDSASLQAPLVAPSLSSPGTIPLASSFNALPSPSALSASVQTTAGGYEPDSTALSVGTVAAIAVPLCIVAAALIVLAAVVVRRRRTPPAPPPRPGSAVTSSSMVSRRRSGSPRGSGDDLGDIEKAASVDHLVPRYPGESRRYLPYWPGSRLSSVPAPRRGLGTGVTVFPHIEQPRVRAGLATASHIAPEEDRCAPVYSIDSGAPLPAAIPRSSTRSAGPGSAGPGSVIYADSIGAASLHEAMISRGTIARSTPAYMFYPETAEAVAAPSASADRSLQPSFINEPQRYAAIAPGFSRASRPRSMPSVRSRHDHFATSRKSSTALGGIAEEYRLYADHLDIDLEPEPKLAIPISSASASRYRFSIPPLLSHHAPASVYSARSAPVVPLSRRAGLSIRRAPASDYAPYRPAASRVTSFQAGAMVIPEALTPRADASPLPRHLSSHAASSRATSSVSGDTEYRTAASSLPASHPFAQTYARTLTAAAASSADRGHKQPVRSQTGLTLSSESSETSSTSVGSGGSDLTLPWGLGDEQRLEQEPMAVGHVALSCLGNCQAVSTRAEISAPRTVSGSVKLVREETRKGDEWEAALRRGWQV